MWLCKTTSAVHSDWNKLVPHKVQGYPLVNGPIWVYKDLHDSWDSENQELEW